jgi:branched-chain amino acid transport system substrate-binding protein
MGDWSYGPGGEWTKSSMMQVQYHDIKEGAGLETWKGMGYQTVLTPPDLKTGNVIYPYEKAAQ